ncbi:MAG TPA: hypothetical protein VNW04_22640 [Puia sp.]|nr:hypothetical protein [Puia sp.]
MTKWALLFCIVAVLAARKVAAQEWSYGKDTVAISFALLDWHRGDTVYAHIGAPRTIEQYFNKNLRGIFHADTIITGAVIVSFIVDKGGRVGHISYDTNASNPELAAEVLRVASRMNFLLPIQPTRIGDRALVSVVELKVAYEEGNKPPQNRFRPDIKVVVSPIQY